MDKQEQPKHYHRLLERVYQRLSAWRGKAGKTPGFRQLLDEAKEEAVKLGELTEHEGQKIAHYVQRDVEEAAHVLGDAQHALANWLYFDLKAVEDKAWEMFSSVADHSRVELMLFSQELELGGDYHSGEITGIGTLICPQCQQLLHFTRVSHIPPCPKCHGSVFKRAFDSQEKSND